MSDELRFFIYQCSCGNYVASPTILAATQKDVTKNVRIEGKVVCSNPAHGMHQPEMRRTEVVEAS